MTDAVRRSVTTGAIVYLPYDDIRPNPFNVRTTATLKNLQSLADSIALYGLLHPVLVRASADTGIYEIICGERRWRALGVLRERDSQQFAEVPVKVYDVDDNEALSMMLQENESRADWTQFEKARFFRNVYDSGMYGSMRQMAQALHVGLTTLHRYMRVFDLSQAYQDAFEAGEFTLADMELLIEAEPDQQRELAAKIRQGAQSKEDLRGWLRDRKTLTSAIADADHAAATTATSVTTAQHDSDGQSPATAPATPPTTGGSFASSMSIAFGVQLKLWYDDAPITGVRVERTDEQIGRVVIEARDTHELRARLQALLQRL